MQQQQPPVAVVSGQQRQVEVNDYCPRARRRQQWSATLPTWLACASSCLSLLLFITTIVIIKRVVHEGGGHKCQGSEQNLTEVSRLHARYFAQEMAAHHAQSACLKRIGNATMVGLASNSPDILFVTRQGEIRLDAAGNRHIHTLNK